MPEIVPELICPFCSGPVSYIHRVYEDREPTTSIGCDSKTCIIQPRSQDVRHRFMSTLPGRTKEEVMDELFEAWDA